MKIKILIGILAFIIIVNIVAVDTYLYYHLVSKSAEISDDNLLDMPAPGKKQGDDPLATLNDIQRNKLREIMRDFRNSTGKLNGRIRILDDEIFNLIQAGSIQKDKIDQDLKEISALRLDISIIAIDKIIGTKSFLSKEQQERLFSAIFRVKTNVQVPRNATDSQPNRKFNDGSDAMPNLQDVQYPPKENRLEKFSEKLALTRDQITRVDEILNLSQNKYRSLESKEVSDPTEFRKEMKAIMDEEDSQIEKLLTSVQKKNFVEMKMNKGQGRRPPRE